MLNCNENLLGPGGAGGQRGSNALTARERAFLNANQGYQARLIDDILGEGGGGAENGRAMEGEAREEGVKVRRGRKGGRSGVLKEKWSDEERIVLWECEEWWEVERWLHWEGKGEVGQERDAGEGRSQFECVNEGNQSRWFDKGCT